MQKFLGLFDWMFNAGELNVRATDVKGQTPLICAAKSGMPLMVDALLRAGPKLDLADLNSHKELCMLCGEFDVHHRRMCPSLSRRVGYPGCMQ